MLLPAQVFVDPLAERAGALSVDDPNCVEMGQKGVVQVFVQFCYRLVNGTPEQVEVRFSRFGA